MVLAQALHWMNEHEQAPTVSDPATSNALTGETSKCWNLAEARGLMNVSHGKFRKRVFSEEEKVEKKVNFLYCETNGMIYEHFKTSDSDATVLDLAGFIGIEPRRDNVQTFDTKWDETIIAMDKQPDEKLLDNFFLIERCISCTRFRNPYPRVTPK